MNVDYYPVATLALKKTKVATILAIINNLAELSISIVEVEASSPYIGRHTTSKQTTLKPSQPREKREKMRE